MDWLQDKKRVFGSAQVAATVLAAGMLALLVIALSDPARALPDTGGSEWCLRCHGMKTLGYVDPVTREAVDLSVDFEALKASNHGKLNCLSCHDDEFKDYPHSNAARAEYLDCLLCHETKDDHKFAKYRFREIYVETGQSVHYRKFPEKFDCFSCHDPHLFEVAATQENIADVIAQDNGMCLQCHTSPRRFASLGARNFPELDATHDWLPNPTLHWETVRCVECHTDHVADRLSHKILGRDEAERDCVVCHSKDSILLTKLYRHRVSEERQKAGFVNAVLLNDAYIIGATRNQVLDWLTYLLVGATTVGVGGHAAARWFFWRRRRNSVRGKET